MERLMAYTTALLLFCTVVSAETVQVEWCTPRAQTTEQPCPNAEQCCAVWGICGTGSHYCKKGHCARGACHDAPVAPDFNVNHTRPPPPLPVEVVPAETTSCGGVLQDINLWGQDVSDGKPGSSVEDCCALCAKLAACGAFTFVPDDRTCYLKSASGWDSRTAPGMKSVIVKGAPSPSPRPSPSPSAPKPASPSPAPSTCDPVLQDVDLFGADLASGIVQVDDLAACCTTCQKNPACGAFTFVRSAGICYLKHGSGWDRQQKAGLQSAVVRSTPGPSPTASPKPSPKPSPVPASPRPSPKPQPNTYQFVPMTQDQMRRMYQLTSVFENANINLQYAYAERLGDDRGVTYGFCGFTTGTGDGLMVVEDYTKRKPSNPLARFLPALRAVAGKGDRFTGLNGFDAEVRKLGKDQDFIDAQWAICDKEYHEPAMEICRKIKCRNALTKAQLHDALVNHGQGLGDKFSVEYILMAAEKAVGGTPATGKDEVAWLKAFLKARYDLLYNWDSTARVSVKRITMYQNLLNLGNLNLDGPIYIDLEKRTSKNGEPVWQIKDVYYGRFLIYNNPDENRRLALIV